MTTKTWTPEKVLVAVTLLLLMVAVSWHTLAEFAFGADGWHQEENQQGMLAVPIVLFLIWMNWANIRRTPVRGNPKLGLAVIGFALLLEVVGVWLDLHNSVGYWLVFAIAGLSLYFLGTQMTKALAFPLAFLLFMVPTPGGVIDEISSPLQLISANAVQVICGFAGVPVHVTGVTLTLLDKHGANVTLQVAEGCSGLHSLTAMAMLSALVAYFMIVPLRWRWGLFALALPVALVGNIARIFCVVMVANAHGQAAGIAFHDSTIGKFLPFIVALSIVLGVGKLLEWRFTPPKQAPPSGSDEVSGGGSTPLPDETPSTAAPSSSRRVPAQ